MFGFFHKKKERIKLFYHTDVHCHIMPGVDHGAHTVEDSLTLLRREMDMGIHRIFLTSHVTAGTFENTPESLAEGFEAIKAAVAAENLDVELHYSAEYRMDDYWIKQRDEGNLIALPNNFILLENSFQQELMMLDDIMFDIQMRGFRPILAHPERYRYYGYRHDRLRTLHNAGVLFQVNLLSLAGYFGTGARTLAEWIIDNDMCDLLGSDMHNIEHADVIEEYLRTKDWRKMTKKLEDRLYNDRI